LAAYGWPGNIRELKNVLYRAAVQARGGLIRASDIGESLAVVRPANRAVLSARDARTLVENHGGNVSAAARQVGVARSTLRGWIGATGAVAGRSCASVCAKTEKGGIQEAETGVRRV
jgi:DNA-binding NtrC family response regulator